MTYNATNTANHHQPGDACVKKAAVKPKKSRTTTPKSRTSIWLDDDLRARLDERAKLDRRSLAQTIDHLLRAGLGRQPKKAQAADATIFG